MTTTIKVQGWTKEQLDAIKEDEDHSSYDSVIKSLLKDREYRLSTEEDSGAEGDPANGELE